MRNTVRKLAGTLTTLTTPSMRRALRAADRWTVRTFNPMPRPFGLGPERH